MTSTEKITAEKIAELNDRLRAGDYSVGIWNTTPSIRALDSIEQQELFRMIRTFDNFESGNDSYGERDFGSVDLDEERYFFKIDYFDKKLRNASEDPSNTEITTRVMTIMHSSEY